MADALTILSMESQLHEESFVSPVTEKKCSVLAELQMIENMRIVSLARGSCGGALSHAFKGSKSYNQSMRMKIDGIKHDLLNMILTGMHLQIFECVQSPPG